MARTQDRPLASVALDLGISETTLRKWLRAADAVDAEPSQRSTSREIESLKRQLSTLTVEVELLKRATAYSTLVIPSRPRR